MRKFSCIPIFVLSVLFFSCETENIEEKYFENDSIPEIEKPAGEIAWYPLNGNLNDSTENDIPILFIGDTLSYIDGLNEDYGQGIHLDGTSYLLINLGYFDTLSFVLWIKSDEELSDLDQPVLFDYGQNAISILIDGSSGASMLNLTKNDSTVSSEDASIEYLNTFSRYSFLYFEAGGDLTRIYFKGYVGGGSEVSWVEDLEIPGFIDTQSEMLYIGSSSLRGSQLSSYFKGAIDEIHIFSRTLTDQEIESFAFIQTN